MPTRKRRPSVPDPLPSQKTRGPASPKSLIAQRHDNQQATPSQPEAQSYDELRSALELTRVANRRLEAEIAELIEANKALRSADTARGHLAVVLDMSHDALTVQDYAGLILAWNRGAERMYGYTRTEAVGMNIQDLVPPQAREEAIGLLERVAHGQLVETYETQRLTKDGRTLDVWLTITPLDTYAGHPAVAMTARDVTERKRLVAAEQAGRVAQELVAHLPAGAVYVQDDDITLNRTAEVLTGYTGEQLKTVDEWVTKLHGRGASDMRQMLHHQATGEVGRPITLSITPKSGGQRDVEFIVHRVDRRLAVWLLFDVTAQRLLQRELMAVLHQASDAIVTLDSEGVIKSVNPAVERMFGYGAADIRGQRIAVLVPAWQTERHGSRAPASPGSQKQFVGHGREVIARRKDGATFAADLTLSEISDRSRQLMCIFRDLSQRKLLERRLAEGRLAERQGLARDLHDGLGGQLTGVGLLVGSLERKLAHVGSELAPRVSAIAEAVREAQRQLRGLARGLKPVEDVPEGLMVALRKLADQCGSTAGLSCRFLNDPEVLVEDPVVATQLFWVAREASSNVIRHAGARHMTITLGRDETSVTLRVVDDGIGMRAIAEGPVTMGLVSMQERCKELGGDISIESSCEGGTVVSCVIPDRENGGRDQGAVRGGERP